MIRRVSSVASPPFGSSVMNVAISLEKLSEYFFRAITEELTIEMDDRERALASEVIAALNEFHTTNDSKRRDELDTALNQLKISEDGFKISFYLLDFEQPTIVQHFGACIFYDTIRERWEQCTSNETLMTKIKQTLLEKLALGAPFLNQSVTNKLTSSLAIFALCCMPDIWPEPIQDLATMWNDKPELLLRVLAELAAEFYHVQIPLAQRSVLKSSLHRKAEDIIRIINVILCDKDASPSLRNAAVECLEQWIRLPRVELMEWQPALLPFLGNISDRAALARILCIMSAHPDLPRMESLSMDLCTFLTNITCPAIAEQLDALNKQYKQVNNTNRDNYIAELEEYELLVSALSEFFSTTVHPLLLGCVEKRNAEVLRLICTFFEKISLWPGVFPFDEVISDAPEPFWNTLREDLLHLAGLRVSEGVRDELIAECSTFYIRLLWSAVTKLAYPPQNIFQLFDQEQIEDFERYRYQRVEASLNAFALAPSDCTSLLVKLLAEGIAEGDICRVEVVLYLLERIADHMSENDAGTISRTVELCTALLSWQLTDGTYGAVALGKSLMSLFYSLSHLISTGEDADKQETVCMELAMAFIDVADVAEEAFKNLEKFAGSRTTHLEILDRVMQRCYEYFVDSRKPHKLRICAVRCMGLSLALCEPDYVLKGLDLILTPCIKMLQRIAGGQMATTSSQAAQSFEAECIFELDVLAAIIATQKPKSDETSAVNHLTKKNTKETAIHAVMCQCMPLLLSVLPNFVFSVVLVEKVCDVLRSGLIAAVRDDLQSFLDLYCDILDFIILSHSVPACNLAKSLILFCASANSNDTHVKIATRMTKWFRAISDESMDNTFREEHIELAYHIVKKDWKLVNISPPNGYAFLRTVRDMALKILAVSKETSLCRMSASLLGTVIRNIINNGVFTEVLREAGEPLISVVFIRLQSEMIKSVVEALAEVLMLLSQNYPLETRQCLNGLPYGNTQEVMNMLKEIHNPKTFKHLTLQFNIQRQKEMKIHSKG